MESAGFCYVFTIISPWKSLRPWEVHIILPSFAIFGMDASHRSSRTKLLFVVVVVVAVAVAVAGGGVVVAVVVAVVIVILLLLLFLLLLLLLFLLLLLLLLLTVRCPQTWARQNHPSKWKLFEFNGNKSN